MCNNPKDLLLRRCPEFTSRHLNVKSLAALLFLNSGNSNPQFLPRGGDNVPCVLNHYTNKEECPPFNNSRRRGKRSVCLLLCLAASVPMPLLRFEVKPLVLLVWPWPAFPPVCVSTVKMSSPQNSRTSNRLIKFEKLSWRPSIRDSGL